MAEYINRENIISALKNVLKKHENEVNSMAYFAFTVFIGLIKEAPTADVVEVVRCKDCKHFKPQNQSVHWSPTKRYCMRKAATRVNEDDFCSYGKKKGCVDDA